MESNESSKAFWKYCRTPYKKVAKIRFWSFASLRTVWFLLELDVVFVGAR